MRIPPFEIPQSLEECTRIQEELRRRVQLTPFPRDRIRIIGGGDVTYREGRAIACIITFLYPHLEIQEIVYGETGITFPYIPGYLSFREIPPLLSAWEKLSHPPDVLVLDGQGISHPRRMGLATHLGVILSLATIGCAKRRLLGEYHLPPDREWVYLRDKGEIVGVALRRGRKTLFISPGHLVDVESSLHILLPTFRDKPLPEVTRLPHQKLQELLSPHQNPQESFL